MFNDITEAGTIIKKNLPVPIQGSILDNLVQPPKPIDFARILNPLKPMKGQNYCLFTYYINSKIESPTDPYLSQFIIGCYENEEDAKKRMEELAIITGMENWAITKVNKPFTFKLNPDKDNYKNYTIVKGEKGYEKLEQALYDDKVDEYVQMIEEENNMFEYGKKIVNPDSYEYYELYQKTYDNALHQYESEMKRLNEFKNNIDDRKDQIQFCLSKHPEFEQKFRSSIDTV